MRQLPQPSAADSSRELQQDTPDRRAPSRSIRYRDIEIAPHDRLAGSAGIDRQQRQTCHRE